MRKKVFKSIAFTLAALLSIGLIAYPAVSNILYENRQNEIILDYTQAAQTLDSDQDSTKKKALEIAHEYNQRLLNGNVQLDNVPEYEDEVQYTKTIVELLDITGTGVIGVVEIPSLGVKLPIYYGTEDRELEQGVGILEYTSMPVGGMGTHSVLCAHSGLSSAKMFSDLPNMQEGELFFLHVLGEDMAYQVDQIKTVLPEEVNDVVVVPGEDYCTLLTCVPYGVNTHRLLVRGTRVEYTPEKAEEIATTIEQQPKAETGVWLREYLYSIVIGIAGLAVVFIPFLVFVSRKKGGNRK